MGGHDRPEYATGSLNLAAGYDGRDPEGYFYFGYHLATGNRSYTYNYSIFGNSSEELYTFRPETRFSISPPPVPVPEPESWALMASGVLALALVRRRKGQTG